MPRRRTTSTLKLVLVLSTELDLIVRTDSCQARPMRHIINSTYISLDGVIQDPQDWPDNGIEGDGTSLKVQTELLFGCDAMLMGGRTYPPFSAAWMARSGDPFSDRMNSMAKYVVSSTLTDPEWNNTTVIVILTYRVPAGG
jgi:dihydrofolate reductase